MVKIKINIGLFLILIIAAGCKKENQNQQLGIPYVNVDQYVLLNLPTNLGLNSVGGWAYVTAGSRGIVVYHRTFDEFVAFDRHCTWQPEQSCGQVSIDTSTNVFLNCACCTSKFSLIDGSTINGPATQGLLQYKAQLTNQFTLHIYN
jgi:nitrite reductase/ring-hydroxylating ferredoxin subunit